MMMNKAVQEVLYEAIGEDAADKAIHALYKAAEAIRDERPNMHVIVDISHFGELTWGKRVTEFTRSPHDKFEFEDAPDA